MSAETELYKLEFQYCGKIGMLQVQGLITLSWASASPPEQPPLSKLISCGNKIKNLLGLLTGN